MGGYTEYLKKGLRVWVTVYCIYLYCIGWKVSFPNLVSKGFAPRYKSPIDFAQLLFFLKENKKWNLRRDN